MTQPYNSRHLSAIAEKLGTEHEIASSALLQAIISLKALTGIVENRQTYSNLATTLIEMLDRLDNLQALELLLLYNPSVKDMRISTKKEVKEC